MKKVILSLMASMLVVCFSGCASKDGVVNTGATVHDIAKFGYQTGAKEALSQSQQRALEDVSKALDDYGEIRGAVRTGQEKKPDANTLEALAE